VPIFHKPDFVFRDEGSIVMLQPVSEAAKGWADDHLPDDRLVWGPHIVIDHRMFPPIAEGIADAGLVLAS
jgi:hypothetical protein